MEISRICTICKTQKLLNTDNYHADKSRAHGFGYTCRPCEKKRTRQRYLKNPRPNRYKNFTPEQKDKKKQLSINYRKTQKGAAVFQLASYQKIDLKKGLICDLTLDFIIDIRLNSYCNYCGYKCNGLDRIDNRIGHLVSNVVPCCYECNTAKMNNFTTEEMAIIGQAIKAVKDSRL